MIYDLVLEKITGTEIPRMARAKKRENPRDFPKAAKTASVAMLGKCRKKTAKMAGLTPRWPGSSSRKGLEPIALQNGSEFVQEQFARIFGATPLSAVGFFISPPWSGNLRSNNDLWRDFGKTYTRKPPYPQNLAFWHTRHGSNVAVSG